MKKIILITLIMFSCKFYSQNIIIKTDGDTIYASKIEFDYPKIKYWMLDSNKRKRIKYNDTRGIFNNPDYKLKVNKFDDFTKTHIKEGGKFNIAGSRYSENKYRYYTLGCSLMYSDKNGIKNYYIRIWSNAKLGCSGSINNEVILNTVDGENYVLNKDIANVDCSTTSAESIFSIDENLLSILENKEVKSIRLQQSEYHEDFDLIYRDYFKNYIRKIK